MNRLIFLSQPAGDQTFCHLQALFWHDDLGCHEIPSYR